jgi:serine/threonine protein kinase
MIKCPFCGNTSDKYVGKGEVFTCSKCGKKSTPAEVKTVHYGEADKNQSVDPKGTTESPFTPQPFSGSEVIETEPVLSNGTKLGQYEIKELIGRGGMGTVYKAYQSLLERFVAIKVLPIRLASDSEFVKRFSREAKALAGLSHPNIVGIYDIGQKEKYFYFVMEFIDGVTIRSLLEQGKLKPEEALKIVPQLCNALDYAHESGVVHRDIKPENILIDKKGRIKVTDFGLARIVKGEMPFESITKSNMIMGTYDYMAPEQRHDPKKVDHRADIYSLGVVFYEMLTGELPVGRFSLPSKTIHVDIRLDEIVLKALEKEPSQRYQRVSELGEAVSEITPDTGVTSSKQPLPRKVSHIAVIAFVLSFFAWVYSPAIPIIIVIGSIVALVRILTSKGILKGIGWAVSGIIVSLITIIFVSYSGSPQISYTTVIGENEYNESVKKLQVDSLSKLALVNEIYRRAGLNEEYNFAYAISLKELCENGAFEDVFGKDVGKILKADEESFGNKAVSYKGYFFRLIPENPDISRKDVMNLEEAFAIAAYPAKPDQTARPTFIIDQRGIIYAKDLGSLKYPSTWNSYQFESSANGKTVKKEIDPQKDGWTIVERVDLSDATLKRFWQKVKNALSRDISDYSLTLNDFKVITKLNETRFSANFKKQVSYGDLFEELKRQLGVEIKLSPEIYYNFPNLLNDQLPSIKFSDITGDAAIKAILNISMFSLTYEVKHSAVYIVWKKNLLPPLDEKPALSQSMLKISHNLISEIKKLINEKEYSKAGELLTQLYNIIPESAEVRNFYWYLAKLPM